MPHTAIDTHALLERLPGYFMLIVPESTGLRILSITDDYARLLEVEKERWLGKGMDEFISCMTINEEDAFSDRIKKSLEAVINTRKPDEVSFFAFALPGPSERYGSISHVPVLNNQGDVEYIIHSLTDITETVRLSKQVEESDVRLRNLVLNAPQPMALLTGPQLIWSSANSAMLKIWGKDESVLGRPVFDALTELSDQRSYRQRLENVYWKGEAFHAAESLIYIKVDGHYKPCYFNLACTALRESDNSIYGVIVMATDVTEEVTFRHRLQENEAKFRNMILHAPVAIAVVKGSDLILESANSAMLEIWGKPPEILGVSIVDAIPEIEGQPFADLLRQVYETGRAYHGFEMLAYLMIGGKMEERYFNFIYAPVREELNDITGVMMIANDVTAQVKAKLALQESEKRFRDLVAEAPVATAIYTGEDMVIQLANEAMLRLWGKDGSVIGKNLREAIPELHGQPFLHLLHQVYTTGVTYKASEDRADLVVDGRLQSFYFNFTYKPLIRANGEIYGILNMAIDVTELVLSRQRILEGEEKWRLAVEVTEIGTFSFDPGTNRLDHSPRVAEIFTGSSDFSLSREDLEERIHPDDRYISESALQKALKTGVLNYEVRIVQLDKSIHWIKVRGKVIFHDERPALLHCTVLDITASKLVEEELEERVKQRTWELQQTNKDLAYSNRELEQYAYVASHDLQEPLRKIITYGSLLRQKSSHLLDATSKSRLDKIMQSASRMSNLINDLLNFSRLLKEEQFFKKVDLNRVLTNVINDFELTIQEKKAIIHKGTLPEIEASSQQMNQLFYNLLSNALKFSKSNGQPVISIQSRLVGKEELPQLTDVDAGYLYYDITVSDNGIGFSKDHSQQIFEVFKRLHTREIYPGSGIGLALCRKIALNHQGDIFAESKDGEGSTFHILLPSKQKQVVADFS